MVSEQMSERLQSMTRALELVMFDSGLDSALRIARRVLAGEVFEDAQTAVTAEIATEDAARVTDFAIDGEPLAEQPTSAEAYFSNAGGDPSRYIQTGTVNGDSVPTA